MTRPDTEANLDNRFATLAAEVFRDSGWSLGRRKSPLEPGPRFLAGRGKAQYAVVMKVSSEGRRDRLIPLLSQAILEARDFATGLGGHPVPMAVVAARRVPPPVVDHLHSFAARYARDVAVGVVDFESVRTFTGPGLEGLNVKPARKRPLGRAVSVRPEVHLFSDLNQWMLKILLGAHLPEHLISVPRRPVRNASQLARAGGVSVMTATRFVNELASRGFLGDSGENLEPVRIPELLEEWVSAGRRGIHDVPARWIVRRGDSQLLEAIARLGAGSAGRPRVCAGLFAAADALGLGFVRGVAPHIYMERMDPVALRAMGLSLEDASRRPDVMIRIPTSPESVFRAAVSRGGAAVCDILQVWLDASIHPVRGREQAEEIRRRVLKPLLGRRS